MYDCPFCSTVSQDQTERKLQNKVLAESEHFVVLPAVGPLVPGHVLVVSREHLGSLAVMGRSAIRDYEKIRKLIAQRFPLYRRNLLQAEHGSAEKEAAGACIVHTHINLIPGLAHWASSFKASHTSTVSLSSLTKLADVSPPYLLLRAGGQGPFVSKPDVKTPSQYLRRELCRYLGRDDWDWGAFPNFPLITKTVRMWIGPEDV